MFAVHGIRVSKATTLHHHHTFSVPRPRRGRGPLQNSNEPRGCRRGRAGQAGLQVGREMAEAGAGADQGPEDSGAPETAGPGDPRAGSDWAGLPEDLLVKVAGKLVAQSEAAQAAQLKRQGWSEESIQWHMEKRKRNGNCLFVFARVCKPWRKAQLKVGGPLRSRVWSDVVLPGSVALAKWALAEGCPRHDGYGYTMAEAAADYGQVELVKWLCGEGGFAMDVRVMAWAAKGGNLELVQWLRAEGCRWDADTCHWAVDHGHEELLRWARENGCPWDAYTRNQAAAKLGYTDDFGIQFQYGTDLY